MGVEVARRIINGSVVASKLEKGCRKNSVIQRPDIQEIGRSEQCSFLPVDAAQYEEDRSATNYWNASPLRLDVIF